MKLFFLIFLLSLFSVSTWADSVSSLGSAKLHHLCQVKSVAGEWAMINYPTTVDFYIGKTGSGDDDIAGYLVMGFRDGSSTINPVKVEFFANTQDAGYKAFSESPSIIFTERKESTDKIGYDLVYFKDSGRYVCQYWNPGGITH